MLVGEVVELVTAVVEVVNVVEVVEVVEVVTGPVTGLVRPGSGVPAISPAPVAEAFVDNGTPGAGGSFGSGGMLNSSSAARAILANVGADAAAP